MKFLTFSCIKPFEKEVDLMELELQLVYMSPPDASDPKEHHTSLINSPRVGFSLALFFFLNLSDIWR